MALASRTNVQQASLSVEFAHLSHEESMGDSIEWSAERCQMPDPNDIPTTDEGPSNIRLAGGGMIPMPSVTSLGPFNQLNSRYYHDLADHEFARRFLRRIRLVVANTGETPALDGRLETTVLCGQDVVILDSCDVPDLPRARENKLTMSSRHVTNRSAAHGPDCVSIERNQYRVKIEMDCGNLQPGRRVWSECFYAGVARSGIVQLTGHLLAANLSAPREFTLTISATIVETTMTVDELLSLSDPFEEEEN